MLTEDFRIVVSSGENKGAEIASSMTLSTGAGEKSTLKFQQPITLNAQTTISDKAKSKLAFEMLPNIITVIAHL